MSHQSRKINDWDQLSTPLTSTKITSRYPRDRESGNIHHSSRRRITYISNNQSKSAFGRSSSPKKKSSSLLSSTASNDNETKSLLDSFLEDEMAPLVLNQEKDMSFPNLKSGLYVDTPKQRSLLSFVKQKQNHSIKPDSQSTIIAQRITETSNDKHYNMDGYSNRRQPISTISTQVQTHGNSSAFTDDHPAMDQGGFFSHGLFCCICVRTQEVGIMERFGDFQRVISKPGLYCIPWPIVNIAGRLSLRIQQLDVKCETKTKDNVFVQITIATQYRVIAEKTYNAYYRLTDPKIQIQSYVYDVVRSTVPTMELDDVYVSKNNIASDVREKICMTMLHYGYEIVDALVIDISPADPKIKASMNEINASKRLKEAMAYKAESAKIQKVKTAEAHCEALYLSGIGTAKERTAISQGLNSSLIGLASISEEMNAQEAMNILLVGQYLDMISRVGGNSLLLEYSPSVLNNLKDFRPTDIESKNEKT